MKTVIVLGSADFTGSVVPRCAVSHSSLALQQQMISSFILFVEKEALLETANEIGKLQPVAKNAKDDTAPGLICA